MIEPVRMGIPRSQPVSTTDQLKIPLSTRYVTNTPFIVQQAKQTMNARVFRKSTLCAEAKEFSIINLYFEFQNYFLNQIKISYLKLFFLFLSKIIIMIFNNNISQLLEKRGYEM